MVAIAAIIPIDIATLIVITFCIPERCCRYSLTEISYCLIKYRLDCKFPGAFPPCFSDIREEVFQMMNHMFILFFLHFGMYNPLFFYVLALPVVVLSGEKQSYRKVKQMHIPNNCELQLHQGNYSYYWKRHRPNLKRCLWC